MDEPASAGVVLCDAHTLVEAGDAFLFELLEHGQPQRAFVMRWHGRVVGYLNRCAHVPAEMDWQPGRFLDAEARFIVCSIHGAIYEPADGRCVGGPCGRGRLVALQVDEREGKVHWYPSPTLRPAPSAPAAP
jgi:nitrite reductase/ring-hydroxylating ferredoxin subunit